MKCNHEWEEDELFKEGCVVMAFGSLNDMHRETRMICKKCGEVDYVKVLKDKSGEGE